MVAPNIVTAKSIVAKTETVNLTTAPAVLLQNSANSNQLYKISALFAANVTDSAATITVILTKAGDSGTIAKKIAHEIPIPANSTLTLLDRNVPIYLEERMTLIIYANVDLAIDVVCAYEEIGEKLTPTIPSSSSISLSSASLSSSSISLSSSSISLSSASLSSSSISLSSSSLSSASLSSSSISLSSASLSSSSISLSSSSLSSASLSSSSISLSSSSLSSASLSSSSISLSSSSSSSSSGVEFACVTPKAETFACITPKPGMFNCVEPLPGTYLCVEQIIQSSSSSGTDCANIPDRFSGGTPSLFGDLTGFKATEDVIFAKTEDGGWSTTYVVTNTTTEYCAQECQIETSISLFCEDNKLNVSAQLGGVDCEIIFDDEIGNEITTDENGNTILPGFLMILDTIAGVAINCNDGEQIEAQCLCPVARPCDQQPEVPPPWPPGPADDLAIKLEVDAANRDIFIPPPAPPGPQQLRLGLVDCDPCANLFVTAELVTGSAENETTYNNIVEMTCSAGPVTRIGQGRYVAQICPETIGEILVTFTATWKDLTKSETVTVNVAYCPTPSDTSDTSSEPSDAAGCGYIECGGTQSYADCYLIDDGLTYELDCAACECVPVAAPSHTSGESTTSDNSAAAGQCDYPCEMMWSYGNWIPTGMYGPGCDGFTCVCPEPDRPGNYENELVFMTCQPNPLP